jgi:hypothetical protein
MLLPVPPPKYDQQTESRRNLILKQENAKNRKNNADVVVGNGQRLIMYDANGVQYVVSFSTTGGLLINGLPFKTALYTVATLPAAGNRGRRAHVSDATAPTFLGTLTGGGTVSCPVFDNGTAWVPG